jgi:uncharacterized protein (UPF0264 family)
MSARTLRGLLVSVRNAAEAAEAVAGGAGVIDVKEPLGGPLGAAEPEAIVAVAAVVADRLPWTMACGELAAGEDRVIARLRSVLETLPAIAVPPAAIKVGLAGLGGDRWADRLATLASLCPAGIGHVAVAYADWERAGAPDPFAVIGVARAAGCGTVLIDTFDKAGPGLLAAVPRGRLADWITEARRCGLAVALAGRVGLRELAEVAALGPEVVALRSAVCFNGRSGVVQRGLVRDAANALTAATRPGRSSPHHPAAPLENQTP